MQKLLIFLVEALQNAPAFLIAISLSFYIVVLVSKSAPIALEQIIAPAVAIALFYTLGVAGSAFLIDLTEYLKGEHTPDFWGNFKFFLSPGIVVVLGFGFMMLNPSWIRPIILILGLVVVMAAYYIGSHQKGAGVLHGINLAVTAFIVFLSLYWVADITLFSVHLIVALIVWLIVSYIIAASEYFGSVGT